MGTYMKAFKGLMIASLAVSAFTGCGKVKPAATEDSTSLADLAAYSNAITGDRDKVGGWYACQDFGGASQSFRAEITESTITFIVKAFPENGSCEGEPTAYGEPGDDEYTPAVETVVNAFDDVTEDITGITDGYFVLEGMSDDEVPELEHNLGYISQNGGRVCVVFEGLESLYEAGGGMGSLSMNWPAIIALSDLSTYLSETASDGTLEDGMVMNGDGDAPIGMCFHRYQ